MTALKTLILVSGLLVLTACGGSNNVSSNSGGSTNITSSCGTSTGNITLNGTVMFERVPHSSSGYGLDYTATYDAPARGVTVEAINTDTNGFVATGQTDSSGAYSLSVPNNTNIKIRVLAQMLKTGSLPNWNFSVKDNTTGNAQYSMDGSASCTATTDETRNLTALSGWGGSSYTSIRAAAPFAILDTVYDAMQLILGVNATINFPALNLYWSPNNTDTSIGTSYFDGNSAIYLLGDQNVDTDEYDPSVIAHEWGHYIEANFSRSDSIGGFHSTGDYLDMRVAFGEGFGNAFSSMARYDPVYSDSSGSKQGSGFGFNVETETVSNPGWYSESSVEKILYDLYDSTNDSADQDTLSLGFQPIWDVLINEERRGPVFTSIFKFITALKARNPSDAAAIDTLINAQNIHVDDVYGSTETNDAGVASILPIYATAPASNVCVTKTFTRNLGANDYNVLGMSHYLRYTPLSTGNYQFTISGSSGDPDAVFYNGSAQNYHGLSTTTTETFTESLSGAQEYMFEIFDYNMLYNPTTSPTTTCFNISVVKQ
jgi:hypothetical protein